MLDFKKMPVWVERHEDDLSPKGLAAIQIGSEKDENGSRVYLGYSGPSGYVTPATAREIAQRLLTAAYECDGI